MMNKPIVIMLLYSLKQGYNGKTKFSKDFRSLYDSVIQSVLHLVMSSCVMPVPHNWAPP